MTELSESGVASQSPKNIALAMSGGGFRAAAFSLGTLSYLNYLKVDGTPLLENVKFIGSTSGGSITNIAYTVAICNGRDFGSLYTELSENLSGEKLMASVFSILQDDSYWKERSQKSRNLINAFSIAYDQLLYGQKTFGFINQNLAATHLDEICVNATEFSNGISFRFQTQSPREGFKKGRVGNNYIYFLDTHLSTADQIKLGDILACSSCFTGGFEPFIFPDDFTYQGLGRDQLSDSIYFKTNPFTPPATNNPSSEQKKFAGVKNRFGIMDGGVADNQAVDSVLLSNKRRPDHQKYDMVILTDVTSFFMDGYSLPLVEKGWLSSLSPNFWVRIWQFLALAFCVMLVSSYWTGWKPWMSWLVFPGALTLITWIWATYQIRTKKIKAKEEKSTWGIILFKYAGYFLKIPFYSVRQMLLSRIKSVFLLANDIYLKQIRRQYYQYIYNDPAYKDIIVANAIYDLSTVRQKMLEESNEETRKAAGGIDVLHDGTDLKIPLPSPVLMAVAETARLMDTTLWFDENQEAAHIKAAIIATGQFTTCYNLLKQALKTNCFPKQVQETLLQDWKEFNRDPFVLYNKG